MRRSSLLKTGKKQKAICSLGERKEKAESEGQWKSVRDKMIQ